MNITTTSPSNQSSVVDTQVCMAYCLADKINLENITNRFGDRYVLIRYKDVCHVHDTKLQFHLYIFRYGSLVFWGGSEDIRSMLINQLRQDFVEEYEDSTGDNFTYTKGTGIDIKNDFLSFLPEDTHTRLAFSHAIAQSVKLNHFEDVAVATVESTRSIPEALAIKGKIDMHRKDFARMRGKLYLVSAKINLQHDLLDIPEYYWENPAYEGQYQSMARYLEIVPRIGALNRKLDVIHELFDMLADEQKHNHSAHLEWVIIILITFEIVMFVLHDILHLF
jgi:uncharacterized Rmd1/YagE family protein